MNIMADQFGQKGLKVSVVFMALIMVLLIPAPALCDRVGVENKPSHGKRQRPLYA